MLYKDEMRKLYPSGSNRSSLSGTEMRAAPFCATDARCGGDWFLAQSMKHLEEAGAQVRFYDVLLRVRSGPGASLGACGLFLDYVFYGQDLNIVAAHRRFLD